MPSYTVCILRKTPYPGDNVPVVLTRTTRVYEIPGDLFQVPTAYVWIFTARLVTGKGLPFMAEQWAIGAGVLFAFFTVARTLAQGKPWRKWIPGGIAVAIGRCLRTLRSLSTRTDGLQACTTCPLSPSPGPLGALVVGIGSKSGRVPIRH